MFPGWGSGVGAATGIDIVLGGTTFFGVGTIGREVVAVVVLVPGLDVPDVLGGGSTESVEEAVRMSCDETRSMATGLERVMRNTPNTMVIIKPRYGSRRDICVYAILKMVFSHQAGLV